MSFGDSKKEYSASPQTETKHGDVYCTLDKVFLKQSSRRLTGSNALVISVYTNEETNPWVQMQLETFYLIDCATLTSGG